MERDGVVSVAGCRVKLLARPGPAGTGWVATMGAVALDPAAGEPPPLALAEVVGWRPWVRGYGDTREAALADLAAELRVEERRARRRPGGDGAAPGW